MKGIANITGTVERKELDGVAKINSYWPMTGKAMTPLVTEVGSIIAIVIQEFSLSIHCTLRS